MNLSFKIVLRHDVSRHANDDSRNQSAAGGKPDAVEDHLQEVCVVVAQHLERGGVIGKQPSRRERKGRIQIFVHPFEGGKQSPEERIEQARGIEEKENEDDDINDAFRVLFLVKEAFSLYFFIFAAS